MKPKNPSQSEQNKLGNTHLLASMTKHRLRNLHFAQRLALSTTHLVISGKSDKEYIEQGVDDEIPTEYAHGRKPSRGVQQNMGHSHCCDFGMPS
jgi:hypothetical protein